MYTDEEEVPLRQVLKNIYDLEGGKVASLDYRKATKEELADFMAKALPNYDRDHVYPSDMKKLVQWYNILVENGVTDFEAPHHPFFLLFLSEIDVYRTSEEVELRSQLVLEESSVWLADILREVAEESE